MTASSRITSDQEIERTLALLMQEGSLLTGEAARLIAELRGRIETAEICYRVTDTMLTTSVRDAKGVRIALELAQGQQRHMQAALDAGRKRIQELEQAARTEITGSPHGVMGGVGGMLAKAVAATQRSDNIRASVAPDGRVFLGGEAGAPAAQDEGDQVTAS